ncbi:MAG: CsiV family protein [Pseudohongiellaceae bacterium]
MQLFSFRQSFFKFLPSAKPEMTAAMLLVLALSLPNLLMAQTSQRWFQIEISIFTNESSVDRDEELWLPGRNKLSYPDPLRRLSQLSDLLITDQMIAAAIDAASPAQTFSISEEAPGQLGEEALAARDRAERLAGVVATGPQPPRAQGNFRFYDFLRDPYLQLSSQDSEFQQTNRALERSSEHRLLFHGLWRESLADPSDAVPLYVQGGLRYGDQHELQGTITLRFNENRDRIVIDSDLWLSEYSAVAELNGEWQLPEIPASVQTPLDALERNEQNLIYGINRVYHMQQSREMRSTEFHYIDHPAMGIVILVEPYDVPPLATPEFDFESSN